MSTILIVVLALVALVFVVLLVAAVLPKKYNVKESIVVSAEPAEVFEFLRHLKNQEQYSKWVMLDPRAKKTYTGADGSVGFISAWESDDKRLGKGEQEITNIVHNERIDVALRFEKPFKSTSPSYLATEKVSAGVTKVTWGFEGAMPYPMNFMMLAIGLPKLLAKDIQESLLNLQNVVENTLSKSISN